MGTKWGPSASLAHLKVGRKGTQEKEGGGLCPSTTNELEPAGKISPDHWVAGVRVGEDGNMCRDCGRLWNVNWLKTAS